MGSILSQAAQKCYREGKKSERGGHVRGILLSPEPSGSPVSSTNCTNPAPTPSLEAS
jgi:hypothetical protein